MRNFKKEMTKMMNVIKIENPMTQLKSCILEHDIFKKAQLEKPHRDKNKTIITKFLLENMFGLKADYV